MSATPAHERGNGFSDVLRAPGSDSRASRSAHVKGLELLRLRLAARISRLLRWEFWPALAIYLPLVPYIAFLGLRHRGITVCTRANLCMPLGGLVGESKWDILNRLPAEWVVPTLFLPAAPLDDRLAALSAGITSRNLSWPIILKPDVGERGFGVERVSNIDEAAAYFRGNSSPVVAQAFHPGPFEIGVFYVRLPSEPRGRIFSITDKRFAAVAGDGRSSLRTLIWRHPRYRLQSSVFLASLGPSADRVPAPGESVELGRTGNHCRGSLFLDGAHLITPEFESAIDSISHRTPGFFFGRFDLRYADETELKSGRGFQIIELNGLLSESTNIYDPATSFLDAQRILRHQWRLAYAIGAQNRQTLPPPGPAAVIAAIRSWKRTVNARP